ncbi:MAG: FAD-dependent oxidoreductase [Pontiella sp.]
MGGFSTVVPDLEYWKENVPCQNACPVHTDARGYVRAIADGDFERAYLIARGTNPLASVCGRVCAAPCEASCRRGKIDDPISIRGLKRFVTTQYGAESNPDGELFSYLKEKLQERQCEGVEELRNYIEGYDGDGAKVAIIGSGPAGMLYVGIPEYRLPRDLIRAEVGVVESLGVEIKCNTCVGKDVTLDQLMADHQAVVLAVGAKKSRALPIPGAEGPGVLAGIDFLRDVALGRSVTLGKKIVVIGGGNVSYDVARGVKQGRRSNRIPRALSARMFRAWPSTKPIMPKFISAVSKAASKCSPTISKWKKPRKRASSATRASARWKSCAMPKGILPASAFPWSPAFSMKRGASAPHSTTSNRKSSSAIPCSFPLARCAT